MCARYVAVRHAMCIPASGRIALFPGPGANFTSNPISPGDGLLYEGSFEASDVVGITYQDLLAA